MRRSLRARLPMGLALRMNRSRRDPILGAKLTLLRRRSRTLRHLMWPRRLAGYLTRREMSCRRRLGMHRTRHALAGPVLLQGTGPYGCCRTWTAVVVSVELRALMARQLMLLPLIPRRLEAWSADLVVSRSRTTTTVATVVADAVGVPAHHGAPIGIVDHGHIDVIDLAIVVEATVAPVTAFVATAEITVAIVDAAIETDSRTPITCAPDEKAAVPGPITRRPQIARLGRQHPGAGHPEITAIVRTPGPVPRRPQVARRRTRRLRVDRQRRRRHLYRHEDLRRQRRRQQQASCQACSQHQYFEHRSLRIAAHANSVIRGRL